MRIFVLLGVWGLFAAFGSRGAAAADLAAINAALVESVVTAERLAEEGKIEEAVYLTSLARELYPENPRLMALSEQMSKRAMNSTKKHTMLGYNYSRRQRRTNVSVGRRILFYLPDRILDLIDQLTFEINLGPQLGFEAYATRAIQVDAYIGSTLGIGWGQKKHIGIRNESLASLGLGPIAPTALGGAKFGTGGVGAHGNVILLHGPWGRTYQNYRDYWAIGGRFGFLLVGATFEYHPLEIVDFVAGWVFLDPLNDDLATTRRLRFKGEDKQVEKRVAKLAKKVKPKKYLEAYPELVIEGGPPVEQPAPAVEETQPEPVPE